MQPRMTAAVSAGGSVAVLGGQPSDEELAAVVAAVDAAGLALWAPQRPRWLVAARREAVGGQPVATPGDLRSSARFG